MSPLDRRSGLWPQTSPIHERGKKTTINQQQKLYGRVVADERASTTTRPKQQVTMNDESTRRMTKWERRKIGLEDNRGLGELHIIWPKRAFLGDEKKEEKK
jgi:hypothetical protein